MEIGNTDKKGRNQRRDIGEVSSRSHGKDAKIASLSGSKQFGRKSVFKPILTSPFTVNWPTINNADAGAIFHTLLSVLKIDSLQKVLERRNDSLPRNSAGKTQEKNERRRVRLLLATLVRNGIKPSISAEQKKGKDRERDSEERCLALLCGINSITRTLEQKIANVGHSDDKGHHPSIIFICSEDVSPPSLTSHFPLLVSSYNAFCSKSTILIPLPGDSQIALSDAVKLRRCGAVSLDFNSLRNIGDPSLNTKLSDLEDKINQSNIKPMHMEWLNQAASSIQLNTSPTIDLIPAHIKHLSSSTPIDMNALKEKKRTKRIERKTKKSSRRFDKKKVC